MTKRTAASQGDLAHWDYAPNVTGLEAACLMLGMDPIDPQTAHHRTEPLLDRLSRAYERAKHPYDYTLAEAGNVPPLASIALTEKQATLLHGDDLLAWLEGSASSFAKQRFERHAIRDWIKSSRLRSLYDFADSATAMSDRPDRGQADSCLAETERQSVLKIIIAAACGGYGFDPAAPRSDCAVQIVTDAAKIGIEITDDTVRKYLREAAEKVLPRGAGRSTSKRR